MPVPTTQVIGSHGSGGRSKGDWRLGAGQGSASIQPGAIDYNAERAPTGTTVAGAQVAATTAAMSMRIIMGPTQTCEP